MTAKMGIKIKTSLNFETIFCSNYRQRLDHVNQGRLRTVFRIPLFW